MPFAIRPQNAAEAEIEWIRTVSGDAGIHAAGGSSDYTSSLNRQQAV